MTARTFLIALGISQYHGSELSVGWQWFRRFASRELVTVLTHRQFDHDRFVNADIRKQFVFLGEAAPVEQDFNRFHIFYTYAFWFSCLKYLRTHMEDGDHVFVVSPAAVWFLPLLLGLSTRRAQMFYGPLGGDLLRVSLLPTRRDRWRARVRNLVTLALRALWVTCNKLLPARIGLRTRDTKAVFPIQLFTFLGVAPEVEVASLSSSIAQPRETDPSGVLELLVAVDRRLRKNTGRNLEVAALLCRRHKARLYVLGEQAVTAIFAGKIGTVENVECLAPLPRPKFLEFLCDHQPNIVALSLSEGVPGYFLEALSAGCWVLSYPFGGVAWLVDCAADVKSADEITPGAVWFRWNDASRAAYQEKTRHALKSMMEFDP